MSAEGSGGERRARSAVKRSAARLAAVQTLYQLELMGGDPEDVIVENLSGQGGARLEGDDIADMDPKFYSDVARGATRWRKQLDAELDRDIVEGWSMARVELILAAVLRCAAYELKHRPDVPARVVIKEYLEIARAFFDGDEPAMVNGVLDAVARRMRGDEMDARGRDRSA